MTNRTETARLIVKLEALRDQLNNEILPLLSFTELDPQIMESAERLQSDILIFLESHEFTVKEQL